MFWFFGVALTLLWLLKQPWFWISLGVVVVILVAGAKASEKQRARSQVQKQEQDEALRLKVQDQFWSVIDEHADELARARLQTVRQDRYGVEDKAAWRREYEYFLNRVMLPTLRSFPHHAVELAVSNNVNEVDRKLQERSAALKAASGFSPFMSATEYERYCAELLRSAGWEARVTKGSGDQGVDVVASKEGRRLVIQCKLYSGSVGNAAVQEVVAAKQFERADAAAVVSNAVFTPAARQLAQSTGTLLLHHSELPQIERRLG